MASVLKVQMFGNFRMEYNGKPLIAEKMHKDSQFNRLMQVMVHFGRDGIPKDKLEEYVVGDRDIDTPHSALRVIAYKTKNKLESLGVSEKDFIYQDQGIYYLTQDVEIVEDAAEFEKRIALAKAQADPEKRLHLYLSAFELYKGSFLSLYTAENWVAQISKMYQDMLSSAVKDAADILRDAADFAMLDMLGRYAAKVDPLQDWEVLILEAMVKTDHYEDAVSYYNYVVDYYLNELGVYPSVKMLAVLDEYSDEMNRFYDKMDNLQSRLDETVDPKGAFFCSFPTFRGIYQAFARGLKRTDLPTYLMLATLVDENGREFKDDKDVERYAKLLKKAITGSIRKNDVFTKYSKTQFLILFTGITLENFEQVQNRISHAFSEKEKKISVRYNVRDVSEI